MGSKDWTADLFDFHCQSPVSYLFIIGGSDWLAGPECENKSNNGVSNGGCSDKIHYQRIKSTKKYQSHTLPDSQSDFFS